MKKIFYIAGVAMMSATLMCSCTGNNNPDQPKSEKEQMLSAAMGPYVNHTVIPTYTALADASVELSADCDAIFEAFEAGTLTEEHVRVAAENWEKARKEWELSEAFLYGPASNHNIDPHIDSWPLDKDGMDAMLGDEKQMAQILEQGADYVGTKLGYGLLGFHAIEYMLYAHDNADKSNIRLHDIHSYTRAELAYLRAVAEDLMIQTVALEACWAGTSHITAEKVAILAEAEIEYREMGVGYANYMVNAGKAGSIFTTSQEAAEELLQGCIDIADEVGNTKIGKPANASTQEDRNYIESPYSLNSIEDFQDNIRSVQNAYCGAEQGDASVSDYIRSKNAELDKAIRAKMEQSIQAIAAIPEPFAKNAKCAEAQQAVTIVGTELVELLQEANNLLSQD